MSRIPTPATIEAAPAASQPILNAVKAKLGSAPNMFRLIANSPAALEGYASLSNALGKGTLGPKTGEAIALAVANVNGCTYCNSAHGFISANLLKVGAEEIAANRAGGSTDPRTDAAVRFAQLVAQSRGQVREADLAAVRAAGFTDAELVEIVAHVALNTLTNYVNEVFGTEIDFPVAPVARAA
jgi:uncharacterized peroxidase-related enzyme